VCPSFSKNVAVFFVYGDKLNSEHNNIVVDVFSFDYCILLRDDDDLALVIN